MSDGAVVISGDDTSLRVTTSNHESIAAFAQYAASTCSDGI